MAGEPEYEWDDAKRRANLARHGVDFADMAGFDWEAALTAPDDRRDYGERRYVSAGRIGDRLHVAVWCYRSSRIR